MCGRVGLSTGGSFQNVSVDNNNQKILSNNQSPGVFLCKPEFLYVGVMSHQREQAFTEHDFEELLHKVKFTKSEQKLLLADSRIFIVNISDWTIYIKSESLKRVT